MKKTIMLLVSVLMGQVVAASDVDLYRGLLFWIKDQQNVEGNELRQTSLPLSTELDGSKAITFSGADLPRRETSAFAFAISFKVGELGCINRLFRLGSSARHFYLDTQNALHFDSDSGACAVNWKAGKVNTWYTIVISHEAGANVAGTLNIYIGEKDTELAKIYSGTEEVFFDCTHNELMQDIFKLGQTDFPSSGYLTSGQFANIRFWSRALSDEECAMADKNQAADMSADDIPAGAPNGSTWDFFPLDGNAYRSKSSSMTALVQNTVLEGWVDSTDRFGMENRALMSAGNGRMTIAEFETLFDGSYVLNNGKSLCEWKYDDRYRCYSYMVGYYLYKIGVSFYYPYPATANENSEVDATYSVWIRIAQMPTTDSAKVLERLVIDADASGREVEPQSTNKTFALSISNTGKLVLEGAGIATTTFNSVVTENAWHMITLVGKSESSIQMYLDGVEIGNVASTMTLGYLPPIDQTYYHPGDHETSGSVSSCATFILGGWDGAADGLTFFHSALTASQVRELYEMGRHPDPNTVITPTTRYFSTNGGGGAIITSGSAATWWARVTEPWITLSSNRGNIGYPVAYTVSATTNAEQRVGYVYINGHPHEVTQDGLGGTIDSDGATYETAGGSGTVAVGTQNGVAWKAVSDVDWLLVSPANGVGSGTIDYQVLPYDEVATRQGTLTVAGNTFTVFQYGRRMKLEPVTATRNYEAHVIPITVNALDTTQWSVMPNNGWISIVDGGNGKGGDLVTIAIAENPSYKARTGTVTIGTETFTVTQQGRPTAALSFSVSPASSTASVNGANGMVSVLATPDLPWTATSGANWITIYAATANGAGNGNVVYSASPNPTLFERTGIVTVTPEAASGMTAKTHTVTQPAAEASLSIEGYEFAASGEPCSVEVSVANIVQWTIEESLDWLTVNGSTSRTGPGTVVLQAAANNTIYPRSGTVKIAGKTFSVSQLARGVEVEYDSKLFDTDGGYESISIHPDGSSAWTAVASDPTWITIFQGDSGTGDGEILYIVAPYVGDGAARTGWIEVGDKKVYITQRAYELSISPNGAVVKGNNGAGEFGVSANIGAVWNAIVTEPWIALVSGYDAGTGSGTVRFICADNNTGRPRVGKIIVSGEEYTVTQSARILVQIQATAGHGGSITGAGTYDKGEKIVLTAVPDSGYQFVRWTGPLSSTENPLKMEADDLTGIKAEFEPMPVDFTSAVSTLDGVGLAWNTLAWATTYRLFRGETDDIASATELATFQNVAVDAYRDESGDRGVTYWYWVMASGDEDDVVSMPATGMRKPIVNSPITYQNLKGATHSNPSTYVEGRAVVFSHPSAITGYTFAGWTPERITEDMTGAQEVWAAWTANKYSIVYDANGGSGSTSATSATYDREAKVAANGFTLEGHTFVGWATNATGAVVFTAGQSVTNLTDVADAQLTFYAVWAVNQYTITFDANGGEGGKTVTQDYGTALAAPIVTRTGYTFAGWSPEVPATVPAANATYVAQWTKNKYTVTFDANGGSGGWSRSMDYGTAITAPTVSRTGCTFAGWTPAVAATVPAGSVTYTAQWKVNQYSVTFDANGGEGGKTVTQDYGTAIAAPTVTRTGYTFAGWTPVVAATVPAGSVTYTAQWKVNQYTVTFDANGGEGGKTVTQDYGTALSVPAVTRTGYTFTGWTPAVVTTVPAGSVTYTAQWKINQYTVTFDANGGEGGKTVTQDFGTALAAPTVTRTGYTFAGWTPAVPSTMPAANATYTAQWTKNKYTVTFNANGGDGGWTKSMDYGAAISAPTVTRTGYAFTGWTPAVAATVPAGSVTYTAQWKINQYTATFDAKGGEGSKTVTQNYGTALAAPAVTRTGYTFAGWSPAVPSTMPAANATYVAQWTKNKYAVTFDANGGDGGWIRLMEYGAAIVVPTVTRTGYTFIGWTPAVAATVPAGNVTYTAQWKANQYTVTFNANGGTGGKTVTQNYGTVLAAPTVTRTGYTLAGWTPAVPSTMPAGNVTYVAQWTKNKYMVTFNANGGTGGWSRSMDYGAAIAAPAVTRTGYTFAGWSPAVARTVPIGGASYTAQWTINRHKVTLSLNGGEGVGSVTVNYGTKVGDLPVPFREGYEFLGWFTAAKGGRRVADSELVTGDMMLYAQWHILMPELYETIDGAAPETAASEYDGYLVDDAGGMKGTIQVKVGKPNKKTGLATVKATVQLGAKKVTLKAEGKGGVQIAADGPTAIGLVGGEPCTVVLGSDGVYGFYGNYEIDGARNFFTSKDKGEQNAANAVLGKWLGGVSILADAGNFTVTISAKGKAKVSGTLANGKKATGNAVFLIGEEWACVPVALPKANVSFALWLPLDGGEVVVVGLGDDVVAGRGGALKAGAAFRIDEDEFFAVTGIAALPYLPDGVSVEPKGAKWVVAGGAKAGKVAYRRGTQEVDEAKLGDNPSGLKLTYKKTDGSFKGSFKAYAEVKGKLKATTVSVSGIVLNGVGYGTATVKGKGSVPVTIE